MYVTYIVGIPSRTLWNMVKILIIIPTQLIYPAYFVDPSFPCLVDHVGILKPMWFIVGEGKAGREPSWPPTNEHCDHPAVV